MTSSWHAAYIEDEPTTPTTVTKCGAKTRAGTPCKRAPIPGAKRCAMHGSATPAARTAAARNQLRIRLNGAVQAMGWAPVTNPALLLANLAGEAEAFKDAARAQMNELDSWDTLNKLGTESVKAVVAVYAAALRDVATVAEKMWRLGIDHTALQLETTRPAREQAEVLSRVIDRALNAAAFDHDHRTRLNQALAQALRDEGLV